MPNTNGLNGDNFPKGTRIRLRLSGAVQKTSRAYSSLQMEGCLPVRETGTDMAWTQFIYLSSKQVGIGGRNEGDTVTAEFDARVVGDYGTGDINTTRVREIARAGNSEFEYQHFLFLPSTTITIVKECAVCQGPLYPVGGRTPPESYAHENGTDDTHVPVDPDAAAIADSFGPDYSDAPSQYSFGAAAPAFATAGLINSSGYEIINSETVDETIDKAIRAGIAQDTEAINARVILSDLDAERTRITRNFGVTAANSITVDPYDGSVSFDTAPDRKEPAVTFKRDDKIRVQLTGTVGDKPEGGLEACTAVVETDSNDGRKWTHYLYLNSSFVRGGSGGGFAPKSKGDTIAAEFDARVIGEIGAALGGTTRVKELVGEGFGYIHYVNLDSSSMSREIPLAEIETQPPVPLDEALKAAIAKPYDYLTALKVSVNSDARISINDKEVLSARVLDRINELEDALKRATRFALIRTKLRAGQERELGVFDSGYDATLFADVNDYNPTRITIETRPAGLSVDDMGELDRLRELSERGASVFGGVEWANGVVLQCNGFFDEDWARDQAADELNQDLDDLDSWPFDLIDWEQAADERKDSDYLRVDFDGEPYFGVNQ